MKNSKKIAVAIACAMSAISFSALCACSDKKTAKTYTVTFDSHGGSAVASAKVAVGGKVKRPADPTRADSRFDAWYKEVDIGDGSGKTTFVKYDFDSRMNAEDLTLHALWIGNATVMIDFDANGGIFGTDDVTYVLGAPGAVFDEPELEPVRDGYIFGGWYTDPACDNLFDFSVFPVENATLYAGWDKDPEYAYITYYGNNEILKVDHVKKGNDVTVPQLFDEALANTLIVGDWYEDVQLSKKHTFGKASTDISLYAAYYTQGLTFSGSMVSGYNGDATEVHVPTMYNGRTINAVGDYAFYRTSEQNQITNIHLPDTVGRIGAGAFYDCRYLVSVDLTENVTFIGENAFWKNTRLRDIGNISSVKSIGAGAFIGCEMLQTVELSSELTSLGGYAFADCNMLETMIIPGKVTAIGEYTFSGCKNLVSVTLKSGELSSIGANAFADCPKLQTVVIEKQSGTVDFASGNPFSNSPSVTVYVHSSQLDAYKSSSIAQSIKDKLAVIR